MMLRLRYFALWMLMGSLCPTISAAGEVIPTAGPLRVSRVNPRYFEDRHGNVVYLTGAHTWNNFQDIAPIAAPHPFDFAAYLKRLQGDNHNFIRLWRFEMLNWDANTKATQHFTKHTDVYLVDPHPWARTGAGKAFDGLPRFDLRQFNPEYFERLRQRVAAARDAGMYVSVMLFEGFGVFALSNSWESHPFNRNNNASGIDGDPNGDAFGGETHQLMIPEVTRLQEAYVRKVVEALNEFDNVLYEIANESRAESADWQQHMVRFIHELERGLPLQHPVGMTFLMGPNSQWLKSDEILFTGPTEWMSPSRLAPGEFNYRSNPPPADGRQVMITDTDHIYGIGGSADWVWKTFTRGQNPIFMDPYDNRVLGIPPVETWIPVRQALGRTRELALQIPLAHMRPELQISSTGYCLTDGESNLVVYAPEGGAFTIEPPQSAVKWEAIWLDPVASRQGELPELTSAGRQTVTLPDQSPSVVWIRSAAVKRNSP